MKRFMLMFISWVIIFSAIVLGIFYFKGKTPQDVGTIDSEYVPNDVAKIEQPEDNLTFVLLGVDAKDNGSVKGQRSDTIMICKYFNDTHKLSVLSVPRDTLVDIPGHGEEKINHAHAYGGPELTLKTLNQKFDMNLEYYVRVDYDVVKDVVDALGGVRVDVPVDMKYEDPYADPPLKINLKKGVQTLDGNKALQFLRFRSGYADQDLGRIKAQQAFIKAVLDKAKEPSIILKAPKILKSTSENISTNISVVKLLSYATAVAKISPENMMFATLPAEPTMIDGVAYVIVDMDQAEVLIDDMFMKDTVPKKGKENEGTGEGSESEGTEDSQGYDEESQGGYEDNGYVGENTTYEEQQYN